MHQTSLVATNDVAQQLLNKSSLFQQHPAHHIHTYRTSTGSPRPWTRDPIFAPCPTRPELEKWSWRLRRCWRCPAWKGMGLQWVNVNTNLQLFSIAIFQVQQYVCVLTRHSLVLSLHSQVMSKTKIDRSDPFGNVPDQYAMAILG